MVDGRFLLQGRGKAGVDSLAPRRCGRSRGSSEDSEARGLFPDPAEAGCARFGWLNFLSKREKDIGSVQRFVTKGIVDLLERWPRFIDRPTLEGARADEDGL